jgi:hypothetical protein
VRIELLEHLNNNNNNNILVEEQFGFKAKSSTDVAIYKLLNEIQKTLNSKKLIGGIFVTLKWLLIVLIFFLFIHSFICSP